MFHISYQCPVKRFGNDVRSECSVGSVERNKKPKGSNKTYKMRNNVSSEGLLSE